MNTVWLGGHSVSSSVWKYFYWSHECFHHSGNSGACKTIGDVCNSPFYSDVFIRRWFICTSCLLKVYSVLEIVLFLSSSLPPHVTKASLYQWNLYRCNSCYYWQTGLQCCCRSPLLLVDLSALRVFQSQLSILRSLHSFVKLLTGVWLLSAWLLQAQVFRSEICNWHSVVSSYRILKMNRVCLACLWTWVYEMISAELSDSHQITQELSVNELSPDNK